MSNGISIFHPRTETFLIFIFPDFLPWLTVAGLHFIVKKISSLQNSPREMRVFKETWQFKITPLADVMEMWSPFWGVFCFSICFSHLCKHFVVCLSLMVATSLLGLQRKPIFGSFPFLVFLGPLIMLTNSALQLVSCPGCSESPKRWLSMV